MRLTEESESKVETHSGAQVRLRVDAKVWRGKFMRLPEGGSWMRRVESDIWR